jgi:2-keto-4-pentenoate hydratase
MTAIDAAVRALLEARRTNQPAPAARTPLPDVQAAYAVQDGVARALGWSAPARHWKSGGPSRDALLTHAPLPAAGVWASPAHAGAWPLHSRGIEAEVALRLARDVDPALARTLDPVQAASLVDAICVSIEIVDTRWAEGLDAPPLAKLADLQAHGALVLGAWTPFAPRDWSTQRCRVRVGAQPMVERSGSHPLAEPTFVLPAWLRHATRSGDVIPAGTVVSTGSWIGIVRAAAGDLVHAEFPGIGDASVQL